MNDWRITGTRPGPGAPGKVNFGSFSRMADAALCRVLARFPQLTLALVYGSVARGEELPGSDVDFLVEAEAGLLRYLIPTHPLRKGLKD